MGDESQATEFCPFKRAKIFAIVVTYKPEKGILSQLLLALAPQVSGGIVINNGTMLPISDDALSRAGFQVRHLQTNTGVATALNIGFRWAQAQDAEFVITFDQDSEPAFNMVELLLDAYRNISATGQQVGAVGPQQVDVRTGLHAPFIAPAGLLRRKIIPLSGQSVEVDHLITSGCLVSLESWRQVGPFLDDLFVDYVDIGWCLRSRYFGAHLYGVGGAFLKHSLGEDIIKWHGWNLPHHNSLRQYFILRNCIYLQKLPYISFRWKIFEALQLVKRLVFFITTGSPRFMSLRAIFYGVSDGCLSRLGPSTWSDD